METLLSAKFEFFVAAKIANKTFKGLKLATLDFFIATLFDESKKIVTSYILSACVLSESISDKCEERLVHSHSSQDKKPLKCLF